MYPRHFFLRCTAVFLLLFVGCNRPTDPEPPPPPTIGTIVVISNPTGADIWINGNRQWQKTPAEYTFSANDYDLQIGKYGYYSWHDTVTIVAGKVDTISVTLNPQLLFPVRITSEPTGASLYIAHWLPTPTPYSSHLDTGSYPIRLTYPEYADWDTTIHHTTGDSLLLHVVMEKLKGNIAISSQPPGAHIFLDNEDTFLETPALINGVLATTHHIQLTLVDYDDWSTDVTVTAFNTIDVAAILQRQTGTIDVTSNPPGAIIFLDNAPTEFMTPATLQQIATGEHTIRIELAQYHPWDTTVAVAPYTSVSVNAELLPIPASLSVTSTVGTGMVFLGGVYRGTTPFSLDSLPDDTYELIVRHPGRFPYYQSFTATFGNHYSFQASADPCPNTRLTYTDADTIFSVGLDGLNPQRLREDYWPSELSLSWAPDGSAMVYAGHNALIVLDRHGNVISENAEYVGGRSNDFSWSPDSRTVIFGRYGVGIFELTPATGEVIQLLRSKSATYDHCPVYSPDGTTIIFTHHEWGYSGWLFVMNADGSNVRQATDRFATEYDEYFGTTWLTNSRLVFKKSWNSPGVFGIDLTELTDTTLAPVQLLSSTIFAPLFFSADRSQYLSWINGHQLILGTTDNWEQQTMLMQGIGIYWLDWSPDFSATAVRCDQGLYWVSLSGQQNRILTLPAGVGTVRIQK